MSFSFFATTVRQAKEQFHDEIARPLKDAMAQVKTMLGNLNGEQATAREQMRNEINALIVMDDDTMYAALTRAAQAAGSARDFVKLAQETRAADATNRREFGELTEQWGAQQTIFESIQKNERELRHLKPMLAKITEQIEDHARAARDIDRHNIDYPNAKITAEDHDRYESFSLLSWMKFWDRGPHHAYKVLGEYTRQHGDYFENAGKIPALEESGKEHAGQIAAREKTLALHSSIHRQMSSLQSNYTGPEKLCRDIRSAVVSLLEQNKNDFASKLLIQTGGKAHHAVIAFVKNKSFGRMETDLDLQQKRLGRINEVMNQIETRLKKAENLKPNKWVSFDAEDEIRAVRRIVQQNSEIVHAAEMTRRAVSAFRPDGKAVFNNTDEIQDAVIRSLIRIPGMDLPFVHKVFTIDRHLARQEGIFIENLRRRDHSGTEQFSTYSLSANADNILNAVREEIKKEREEARRREAEAEAAAAKKREQDELARKNAERAAAAGTTVTSIGTGFSQSAGNAEPPAPRNDNNDDDMFGGDAGITDAPRRSP